MSDAILRKITDFHIVPERRARRFAPAAAGENFQQRRFARAIRPDQHDALPAFRLEI